MGFDLGALAGKDVGIAIALIVTVLAFLHHIRMTSKDDRENTKSLCDTFADRIKDISEHSEKRHDAANQAHEKIVNLIASNHTENTKELCQAHERLTGNMTNKLDEVVKATEKTHALIEAQIKNNN